MKKPLYLFLPATAWVILSTVLLTMPQSSFRGASFFSRIPWFDKWVHIGMFGIMTLLICWAYYRKNGAVAGLKIKFLWIAVACLLYGLLMEFVQEYWVPLRTFDTGDVIADAVGAFGGAWFTLLVLVKK